MSKNEMIKISPLPTEERSGWKSLEDWLASYSEEQVVEMLHRYMDAQCHAKAYRERATAKSKALRSTMVELAQKAGFKSVEEYLGSLS